LSKTVELSNLETETTDKIEGHGLRIQGQSQLLLNHK